MYKKVKRDEVPKRERKSESVFASTPDWKRMKADMDGGLKDDESCELRLTPEDLERIGLSSTSQSGRNTATGTKAVRTFVRKYIVDSGLKYTVHSRRSRGADYIIVERPRRKSRRMDASK